MSLSETHPLHPAAARELPDGPAVYVLWRGTVPVYAGYVDRYTQPLGRRILGHAYADGEDSLTGATHFSYELTQRPLTRLRMVKGTLDEKNVVRAQLADLPEPPAHERRDPLFSDPTLPPSSQRAYLSE